MIKINACKGKITIEGHANYAPHGQDIVCAAISALTQTFIASVEELTNDNLKCDIASGNVVIEYEELSEQSQLLMSSFFVGVRAVEAGHPENIKIEQALNS